MMVNITPAANPAKSHLSAVRTAFDRRLTVCSSCDLYVSACLVICHSCSSTVSIWRARESHVAVMMMLSPARSAVTVARPLRDVIGRPGGKSGRLAAARRRDATAAGTGDNVTCLRVIVVALSPSAVSCSTVASRA